MPLPPLRLAFAAAVLPLLAACQSVVNHVPYILRPYEPDVQQGNVVTKEMVDQLGPGMSREQVRFLLGTPALASVFHQDRWDYVYLLKRGNSSEVQSRRLIVFFKDNRLERFVSDDMPPEVMADNLILGRDPKKIAKPPPDKPAPLRQREVDSQTEVEIITPTAPPIGF
jgi:outer membrane protein assembly factor BamE